MSPRVPRRRRNGSPPVTAIPIFPVPPEAIRTSPYGFPLVAVSEEASTNVRGIRGRLRNTFEAVRRHPMWTVIAVACTTGVVAVVVFSGTSTSSPVSSSLVSPATMGTTLSIHEMARFDTHTVPRGMVYTAPILVRMAPTSAAWLDTPSSPFPRYLVIVHLDRGTPQPVSGHAGDYLLVTSEKKVYPAQALGSALHGTDIFDRTGALVFSPPPGSHPLLLVFAQVDTLRQLRVQAVWQLPD